MNVRSSLLVAEVSRIKQEHKVGTQRILRWLKTREKLNDLAKALETRSHASPRMSVAEVDTFCTLVEKVVPDLLMLQSLAYVENDDSFVVNPLNITVKPFRTSIDNPDLAAPAEGRVNIEVDYLASALGFLHILKRRVLILARSLYPSSAGKLEFLGISCLHFSIPKDRSCPNPALNVTPFGQLLVTCTFFPM